MLVNWQCSRSLERVHELWMISANLGNLFQLRSITSTVNRATVTFHHIENVRESDRKHCILYSGTDDIADYAESLCTNDPEINVLRVKNKYSSCVYSSPLGRRPQKNGEHNAKCDQRNNLLQLVNFFDEGFKCLLVNIEYKCAYQCFIRIRKSTTI